MSLGKHRIQTECDHFLPRDHSNNRRYPDFRRAINIRGMLNLKHCTPRDGILGLIRKRINNVCAFKSLAWVHERSSESLQSAI